MVGLKFSSSTSTKLEGKCPTTRRSLYALPVHQLPSPAFSASMRSPSTNPRSFLLSGAKLYIARVQQGNFLGIAGAAGAMARRIWG